MALLNSNDLMLRGKPWLDTVLNSPTMEVIHRVSFSFKLEAPDLLSILPPLEEDGSARIELAKRVKAIVGAPPQTPLRDDCNVKEAQTQLLRNRNCEGRASTSGNNNKTGELNVDQIKRELADYSYVLDQVPLVYDHVSRSACSKPTTPARVVISACDDAHTELTNELIQEAVDDAIEDCDSVWKDKYMLERKRVQIAEAGVRELVYESENLGVSLGRELALAYCHILRRQLEVVKDSRDLVENFANDRGTAVLQLQGEVADLKKELKEALKS